MSTEAMHLVIHGTLGLIGGIIPPLIFGWFRIRLEFGESDSLYNRITVVALVISIIIVAMIYFTGQEYL